MEKRVCWGIFREADHSPNREDDDAAILKMTAEKLQKTGDCDVTLFQPAEIMAQTSSPPPDLVFYMCEKPEILEVLDDWEKQGTVMVNSPEGVRNTYRYNTIDLMEGFEFFPESVPLSTETTDFEAFRPLWVKRLDFHALSADDVCFANTPKQLEGILKRLQKQNVENVLVQEHAEGDLIKFYGIRSRWFEYFYHKDQTPKHHAFDKSELERVAKQSARLLGLDIYGGDAIITKEGKIFLIDLNAWPSFALYRDIASDHIARLIAEKAEKLASVKS